jgi:ABC-type multidrug transport system ATPase subunit
MEQRDTAVMELRTRGDQTMAQPSQAALELRDVHKHFGAVCAVDGISLSIQPGEIVAFLGPNGAGKTTTIDMMLGLSRPDSGSVAVFGGTPASAIAHGRVSAVMQTVRLAAEQGWLLDP